MGTPPLEFDIETSDIDVLCCAPDAKVFVSDVLQCYARMSGFRIWQWTSKDRPMVETFRAYEWNFELFASPLPVAEQFGWRQFRVERRMFSWAVTASKVQSTRCGG